ncbi:MAG TPA: hypothetical protein VMN38_07790 [Sphingomicrobium sp.]|nr:hypothetical protein [Sphingomicrobium sp.]
MTQYALRTAVGALIGATLGALFLGVGGRIVMRLLAIMISRDPAFSIGGTFEVATYGAIVGSVSGAAFALCRPILPGRWWAQGAMLAALAYAGTIATLPAHIADTARPFAGQMTTVLLLFGFCFALFGLAMARLSSSGTSPAPADAPAAPPE